MSEANIAIKSIRKEKIYLSSLGQKLLHAITSCDFDDEEMTELIDLLTKYHERLNVFSLVKSCCELFDTPKKKSLTLFLRTVIPVKDRFSYEEYLKIFFPSEFPAGSESIYSELVPKELLEKTQAKAEERRARNAERERLKAVEKEAQKEKEKADRASCPGADVEPPITEEQKRLLEEIKMLEEGLKKEDDSDYELKRVIKLLVAS